MSSRDKGKRGELEVAEVLRHMGFDARRSQQYNGDAGGEDITHSIHGVHIEVKRTERLSPYLFMDQAIRDAKGKAIPTVWMRSSNRPWLVTVRADDLLELCQRINDANPTL